MRQPTRWLMQRGRPGLHRPPKSTRENSLRWLIEKRQGTGDALETRMNWKLAVLALIVATDARHCTQPLLKKERVCESSQQKSETKRRLSVSAGVADLIKADEG
jgi:hypothetical protein